MSERRTKYFHQPAPPAQANTAVAEPDLVKLGVKIPRRLNRLLNLEAADREMQKQDLVTQILDAHYAGWEKVTKQET